MKKWKWIGALMLLIGAGYLGFQQYKIYLPGIIGEWREPIAENRPITWPKMTRRSSMQSCHGTRSTAFYGRTCHMRFIGGTVNASVPKDT
jgi:hypothetical protein